MKTLLDFLKDYPNENYGRLTSSYTSCQGRRERDIYKIYEHTKSCEFCKDWLKNRESMAEILKPSNADRQRVIDQMKKVEGRMVANS